MHSSYALMPMEILFALKVAQKRSFLQCLGAVCMLTAVCFEDLVSPSCLFLKLASLSPGKWYAVSFRGGRKPQVRARGGAVPSRRSGRSKARAPGERSTPAPGVASGDADAAEPPHGLLGRGARARLREQKKALTESQHVALCDIAACKNRAEGPEDLIGAKINGQPFDDQVISFKPLK